MDIPLELAFHNIAPSDGLTQSVKREVARLERFFDHIIGCRVVIEMPHKSHRAGSNAPDVHVVLRVPGKEIIVSRELARGEKPATNAYAVIKETFAAAQQQLKNYRRLRRGEVKSKSERAAASL